MAYIGQNLERRLSKHGLVFVIAVAKNYFFLRKNLKILEFWEIAKSNYGNANASLTMRVRLSQKSNFTNHAMARVTSVTRSPIGIAGVTGWGSGTILAGMLR